MQAASSNKPPQQIPLELPVRNAMGREDFLIGASNESAVGWIDRWPNWPAPALILNGPAASGKSHLAAVWKTQASAASIAPETLLTQSAEEIAEAAPSLLIDGLDPWLGTPDTDTTLFHLYNILKEEGRTMLIITRAAPSHIDFSVADLASRLRAAPCANIESPNDTLLQNIIVKMFADRQLSISADVLKYLIPRMERSFIAASDIVAKSDALALSKHRAISISIIRDVLIDMQGE